MLKVKSVVTAAILLVAVGASASNFRVADQVYVPAVGHVAGSSQLFISDIFISNLTSDTVSVSVLFAQGANPTPQTFNNVITLGPNERQEVNDFVGTKLGLTQGALGQAIFNGCKQGGNCNVTTCANISASGDCPDFRNISVESRIYSVPVSSPNPATAPTTGQLFSGIPWYNFVSSSAAGVGLDKVFITGLRNNGQYRTNIGLVNASQFSTTTLLVKLFDGKTNTQIGSTFSQTLGPLGQVQPGVAAMFSTFTGVTATNAYVTVEQSNNIATGDASANGCPDGCPAFIAYGSVLDNSTGDATTLEPQFLKSLWDIGTNPPHGAIACIYDSNCKAGVTLHLHRAAKH